MNGSYVIAAKDGKHLCSSSIDHLAELWAEYNNFEVWKDLSQETKSALVVWYKTAVDEQFSRS